MEFRHIYDQLEPKYAYDFPKAYSKQLLVEYKGKDRWIHINLDDGLVYYLFDSLGYLNQIPLGSHDYEDFFEVKHKPIYELFRLQMTFEEWDNFGFLITNFDFAEVAEKLEEEHLSSKYQRFVNSFDKNDIQIVNRDHVLYIIMPNGDEIRYKHVLSL